MSSFLVAEVLGMLTLDKPEGFLKAAQAVAAAGSLESGTLISSRSRSMITHA